MSMPSISNPSPSAMFSDPGSPSKRLVRSKSGLKIVCQHERDRTPWALEEPHWVKDHEVANCLECKVKFDFIKRRHHCRRCGNIFCAKCCKEKIQFHRMGFVDPVRVCSNCLNETKEEKDFFDQHLKTLFSGAIFHVESSRSISKEKYLYFIKLSSDERNLFFDNHGEEGEQLNSIDLCKIQSVEPLKGEKDEKIPGILIIKVKEGPELEHQLTLSCPEEPSRKPALVWIDSFQKGIKLVFDSRNTCRDDNPLDNDS